MSKFLHREAATLLFHAVALTAWLTLPLTAPCQSFDLEASRLPIAQVDLAWRFHLGDNPGWSRPDFNDSGWSVLKPTEDWTEQGFPEKTELAWFRFHLRVPAHTPTLVLELPTISKSYQLFSDGRLVGQVGTLPPGLAYNVIGAGRVFSLPVNSGGSPKDVAIAIRVWQNPATAGTRRSFVRGPVYAGSPETVLEHFDRTKSADLLSDGSIYTIDLVKLIVGVSALILFWLTRERFYLWYAIYLIVDICFFLSDLMAAHQAWSFNLYTYSNILFDLVSLSFFILFIVEALYPGKWKLAIAPVALVVIAETSIVLVLVANTPTLWADITYCVCQGSISLFLIWYLLRSWRTGSHYARILLFPLALNSLGTLGNNIGDILIDFSIRFGLKLIPSGYVLVDSPFAFDLDQLAALIILFAFLAALVYRFADTSREKQRLASALEAARDIQQRLVPVDIPSIGGLHVEIAYRAAEEVGGDFCQILPRPDGSIFVAIGDVSGKGLQAAMLGAVAVGALRSIADEQVPPSAALERLNHVLLRSENRGFITCLCMVLTTGGEIILANAGHLAPYLNGAELPLDASLPLGMVSGITYSQSTIELPDAARLTLLSDGVVEARSGTGELFGFDRTSEVSRLPAAEIAAKAQEFGQQDDITVITLDWSTRASSLALA
jgi:sigma-B regulation protein RsbU (phosphoserine phosphatase)